MKKLYEESSVQAIAAAIRARTGSTETYKIGEMAAAVQAISGSETVDWNQCPEAVRNYLANVAYDPADYSTSQIANFVTTTSPNHPLGATITMKSPGTLTVVDGYTGHTISKSVSAGDVTIYNCTPGSVSKFVLIGTDGTRIIQSGIIKPTGACRMIYMPNADNVRDLGGWACDGGTVKYGRLFRGGEVYGFLTDDGKQQALDMLGILKEIDLRFPEDLNGRADSGFGPTVDMLWVDMTWNALPYQKSSGNIKAIFDPLFDYVIAGKPTYFHCSAGADRTGVVALICEAILGVSQSDCDKDYELTNFYTGVGTDADARRRNETVWTREITYLNTYAGTTFAEKVMNFLLSCGITLAKINAFRAAMIDGTPTILTADIASYSVTKTLNNVTSDSSTASVVQYQPFTMKVAPASGMLIGSIKVVMGGVDITNSVFKGTKDVLRRLIIKNLTKCTSSNTRAFVIDGQSYVTALNANSGYVINSVSITMGGMDVSTYYKDGIISIPEVTGDIVITATAVKQGPSYTNQLANAVDMAGNLIGKTAMYTNKRYNSSSGAPVDYTGNLITGLIPCAVGDTIRIRWTGKNDNSYQQIKGFKANRTQTATGYLSFYNIASGNAGTTLIQQDLANGIFDFTITKATGQFADISYIAIVLHESDINNVIVTVNEPIN